MKEFISSLKEKFSIKMDSDNESHEAEDGYVELEPGVEETSSKIIIRPYVIKEFEDVKPALDALRNGHTILLINIKPLKDKDIIELKRAINKIKKTCDALEGEIAGFGEDWVVATPSFATIYRNQEINDVETVEENDE